MEIHTSPFRQIRVCAVGALAVTTLFVTSCSASTKDTAAAPTTTSAPATTLAPVTTEATTTTIAEEPGQDLPGGLETVGDKSVLLDGFIGVRIPDGWEITETKVPLASQTEGAETDLDTSALDKVLGIEPANTSGAATFSLVHYSHSDKVPNFGEFAKAVRKFAESDGGTVSEPKESRLGGQQAVLHQIKTAKGHNGVLIPFQSGDEYFFILSLVNDTSFSKEAASIISSLSFEPDALHT